MADATTATEPTGSRAAHVTRSVIAVIAVTLGLVCMTVSPLAIWGRNLVLNTDRYVETLDPLASDPGVQAVVINLVSDSLSQRLDVSDRITDYVPRIGQVVGPAVQSYIDGFIRDKTTEFVEGPNFPKLWTQLNRRAHIQLNYLLTGQRPVGEYVLNLQGSRISLDLAPVVKRVEKRLGSVGAVIAKNTPAVGPLITVGSVSGLDRAQAATRRLNTIANVLPFVGIALIGIGIVASHRRRRTLSIASFGVAGGMLVLLIGLMIGRNAYLSGIPVDIMPTATASGIFDILVRFLRMGIRIVFVAGLLVGIATWLAGPGERAERIRNAVLKIPRALGARVQSTRIAPFMIRYTPVLRGAVAVLIAILVMTTDNPTGARLLLYAGIAVVLLMIIEFLRAMSEPAEA